MLSVRLLVTATTPLVGCVYRAGEQYDVREDLAIELAKAGAATPIDCPEQVDAAVDANVIVSATKRAACLARVVAAIPPEPAPDAAPPADIGEALAAAVDTTPTMPAKEP